MSLGAASAQTSLWEGGTERESLSVAVVPSRDHLRDPERTNLGNHQGNMHKFQEGEILGIFQCLPRSDGQTELNIPEAIIFGDSPLAVPPPSPRTNREPKRCIFPN